MNTKEYFGQTLTLNKHINSKLDHLAALRELASKATASISDMPHSDSHDVHQMDGILCKIVDLEKEIADDIDRLVSLKRECMSIIQGIKNPMHQLILEQRYLCCHSWERIGVELEYEQRSLYRLHNQALMAAEELIHKRNF